MKCDELEELYAGQFSPSARVYGALYVNEAIAELKEKLDSMTQQFSKYVVDAHNRERRLKRVLYKACANWAKCEQLINNRGAYEASEYLPSAEDKFRKKAEQWSEMERKCQAKAEEYK